MGKGKVAIYKFSVGPQIHALKLWPQGQVGRKYAQIKPYTLKTVDNFLGHG